MLAILFFQIFNQIIGNMTKTENFTYLVKNYDCRKSLDKPGLSRV